MKGVVIGLAVVGGVLGALYLWGKRRPTVGDLGQGLAGGPGAGSAYGKGTLAAGHEYSNGAYIGSGSWGNVGGGVRRLFTGGAIPGAVPVVPGLIHPTKGFAA